MKRILADWRLFVQQFRCNFHTTGAVLPSGAALCRALASPLNKYQGERRILEVGPGTGAVTTRIVAAMQPGDRLDLVELNDRFVERLEQRLAREPAFQRVADRTRVIHAPIEELAEPEPYDVVISGLPLNNFSASQVSFILNFLVERLKPGGTLSFFEYIGIRRMRALAAGRDQRTRLRGIDQAIKEVFSRHQVHHRAVWPNIPPAWVHHVRVGGPAAAGDKSE